MAPIDSGGNVTRPTSPIPVTGQNADAPQVNVPVDDIYNALNMMVFLDGRKSLSGNIPMNGYKASNAANGTDPQDYVTLSQMQISATPTGSIIAFSGTNIPVGWLALNGQSISRTTYPALWAHAQASGNLNAVEANKTVGQFGPGDGSTTFTLPNLYADNGYFIRPVSSGRNIGSVQADDIKSHGHNASFAGTPVPDHIHQTPGPIGGGNTFGDGSVGIGPATSSTQPAGAHTPAGTVTVVPTGGTETRPKNVSYPFLIKT